MNFDMITLNLNLVTKQDYVTWIQLCYIAEYVERWFDTSNFNEKDKIPLPVAKNKKVIGTFKGELDGKIMTEFCTLRAKAYAFLIDDFSDKDYEKK